jgi:predicted ferric reductase
MTTLFHPYDVTHESDMTQPLDYNRRSRLKHVDRTYKGEIVNIIRLTEMEKLFQVRILDSAERERFSFLPGQFVMVEVPGYGEIPISISSSTSHKGYIELCIRKAGLVTSILHSAQRGAHVGLRGPFGTNFPIGKMHGNNVMLIAGGLGLAPLRAPIFNVIENRSHFQRDREPVRFQGCTYSVRHPPARYASVQLSVRRMESHRRYRSESHRGAG